ncbi:MAG: lipopolysaccharide kinase InaA family protein [Thermoanaerobaculia bacterium]
MTVISFAWPGFRGEAAARLAADDLPAASRALLDPGAATATLHWGRNYIYRAVLETVDGEIAVAVKQFRGRGARARVARRRGESKAAKSFRIATAFTAAGLSTPEPLLWAEALAGDPTAIFVTASLDDRVELRYLLRARNAGTDRESFPRIDAAAAISAVARYARRMHDAGFFHRDFSIGNLLLLPGSRPEEIADVAVLDLNRCRVLATVPSAARMRDLCRLPLELAADRELLLAAYFSPAPVPEPARASYELARRSFLGKNRLKARLRGGLTTAKSWLVPRGVHAHIPPPPSGAEVRDRAVWDRLSDQPHQHAGRWARARIRIADLPKHLRAAAALTAALPRIRSRYRELAASPVTPFAWPDPGIALRPWPDNPAALLAAFDRLGTRRATLRLHPWQEDHGDELALAAELSARGVEIAFTLPQNRELVRDPARWSAAIARLAELFTPFGRRFQIGQAINRSKWGIWNYDEYLDLAARAAEILRDDRWGPGIELFGPAVIDFEAHVTAAVMNLGHPALRFDGLASLLYVDRRGAPENRQLGFDTVEKVRLLTAIGGTARRVASARQWISEVNWPLREGPHSPAGRSVAVDETSQADYLVRYYLLAAGSGLVERIDWWQLVAKGYGLCDPQSDGALRERESFAAFANLVRTLRGAICEGPIAAPEGARAYRFRRGSDEIVAAWAAAGPIDAASWEALAAERVVDRDGRELGLGPETRRLGASVRYFISTV